MINADINDYYIPQKHETVGPQAYLNMVNSSEAENIKHVRFQPPKIGGKGFGTFIVEFKNAKLIKAAK